MTLVVNTIGGPSSGKSTTCAKLFGLMKSEDRCCELVPEYAKELVYEQNWSALANQWLVTGEQDRRLRRLIGQVDHIINDSPLPLGLIYAKPPFKDAAWFENAIWGMFESYRNFNIYISRAKPYQTYGRCHSEEEAHEIDEQLLRLFEGRIDLVVPGDDDAHRVIYEAICRLA